MQSQEIGEAGALDGHTAYAAVRTEFLDLWLRANRNIISRRQWNESDDANQIRSGKYDGL